MREEILAQYLRKTRKGKGKALTRTGHEGSEVEQRYSSTLSLTSVLKGVGGQLHVPAALPPEKRLCIHCIGGWVGPRASPDGYGKSRPHRDSIPGPPARSESLYRPRYPGPHRNTYKSELSLPDASAIGVLCTGIAQTADSANRCLWT